MAQLRLTDLIKEERGKLEARAEATEGRMTFGEALGLYHAPLENDQALKTTSKLCRKCVEALVRSWPDMKVLDVKRISERECLSWASRFARSYSPSVYNNTVGTLRQVLALASDAVTGTKSWTVRRVPMIRDMRRLLEGRRAWPSPQSAQPGDGEGGEVLKVEGTDRGG